MQRYSFPTPPSTNEDSPISLQMVFSPSVSENSSSPIHFPKQISILPSSYGVGHEFRNITNETEKPPCLKVIEQPVDKFRFRYKSEMTGTHGSLNGVNSDRTRKLTYPTVELLNFEGIAMIRCSIWQVNHHGKILPHAHRLVKKKHGKEEVDDPHDILVNKDSNYQATFHSMGIIHTAKKNIVSELIKKKSRLKRELIFACESRKDLSKKEEMEIKGLAEAESKSINLNVVCLRFDAYLIGDNNAYLQLCQPVYSHSINNLKSALTGELKIVRMDHCTSPANGGREIFLLVERVTKKNIKVRFYELDEDDNLLWEDYGKFTDLDVHHQFAIVLRTPRFRDPDITCQVQVCMELVRPTDNAKSEPKFFTYIPNTNVGLPNGKRKRMNNLDSNDYDTPSAGCDVLPTILDEMASGNISFPEDINTGNLPDFDSDEIRKIFDVFLPEFMDASVEPMENLTMDLGRSHLYANVSKSVSITSRDIRPRLFNREYQITIEKVYNELMGLLRTKPPLEEVKEKLRHYLVDGCDDLNAFHMAVLTNSSKHIQFFVKMIFTTGELDLVNLPTSQQGTVIHLATLCENVDLIISLLSMCNADITKCDGRLCTPLHLAADSKISENVLSALLRAKNVSCHLDEKNDNGDTPLIIAVKSNNFRAVQLLCKKGADVDYRHNSSGFTPLRFAVENENLSLIKYLLVDSKADPKIRDFKEVDPLQLALSNKMSVDVREFIRTYMIDNNLPFDEIEIKEEPEDCFSEDEMVICEENIKAEPLPAINDGDDLSIYYENVTNFTSECLDEVCMLLDSSGKWQELAVLLDLEHLLGNKILEESRSPSRYLLNYVVEVDRGSLKEIRDFLDSLDEVKAANAIDEMVKKIHQNGL